MFKLIIKFTSITIFISLLICSIILMSHRNVKEIVTKAPEFMNEHGFILTQYENCNSNIIYGGVVNYYGFNRNSELYKITITMWEDKLIVYNLKPIE